MRMDSFLTRCILALILFVTSAASAKTWISPTEIKYKESYPSIYEKYHEAKILLNEYSGNTSNLVEAKALLEEVITAVNQFAPAYREYARFVIKVGHISGRNFQEGTLEAAEKLIMESIRLEPGYADAYVLLGHLYYKQRNYDKATEVLAKAEDIGTEIPWLHLNWGDVLFAQDKNDAALERYLKVANSTTDNRSAYAYSLENVAHVYRSLGQMDKAKAWHEKVIKFNPDGAWEWGEYGRFLLFYYGDVDDAIVKLETALSLMDYGLAKHWYACALYTKWAQMYKKDGDNTDANEFYMKAFSIQPDLEKIANETIQYDATRNTARVIEQQKMDYLLKELSKYGYSPHPDDAVVNW